MNTLHYPVLAMLAFFTLSVSPLRAQWTELPKPSGAYIYNDLEVHHQRAYASFHGNSEIVLAGTSDLLHWSKIATLPAAATYGLSRTYPDGDRLYLLGFNIQVHAANAYYSDDDGQTWTPVPLPAANALNQMLPAGNTLLCVSDSTVWRSTNQGASWSVTLHSHGKVVDIKHLNNGNILLATPDLLYLSVDAGASWTSQPTPYVSEGELYPYIRIYETEQGLYTYLRKDTLSTIHRSLDEGGTWTEFPSPGNVTGNSISIWDFESYHGALWAAVNGSIYVSEDSAATWTSRLSPDALNLEIMGDTILAGGSNGLFKTTNEAQTWVSGNLGWNNFFTTGTNFLSPELLGFVGSRLYTSISHGMMYTENEGQEWVLFSKEGYFDQLLNKGDTIMIFGYGVLRSFDGGQSWDFFSSNDFENNPLANNGWEYALSNNYIFATAWFNDHLYRSADWGATWQPLSGSFIFNEHIAAVGNKLYISDGDGVRVSSNNGLSFTNLNGGLGSNPNITNMWSAGNQLYVISQYQLFHLVNNTWKPSTVGLYDEFGQLPYIDHLVGAQALTALVGSSQSDGSLQIFSSSNNGDSWVGNLGEGLPDMYGTSVAIHDNTLYLYGMEASSSYEHFWKRGISVKTAEVQAEKPAFSLQPNPALGETALLLDHPTDKAYFVTVTDGLGREVRTRERVTGEKHLLSLAGCPAGLYIVTVSGTGGEILGYSKLVVQQ